MSYIPIIIGFVLGSFIGSVLYILYKEWRDPILTTKERNTIRLILLALILAVALITWYSPIL